MNFQLVKIGPSDDEDFREPCQRPLVRTDAFTVLPPYSPQIPGPPPTPNPYRILPPIVSRKRPSFVILQELGSRPASREPSPSGRVSPFRGCGFKPSSQDSSPTRPSAEPERRRSRSRLPVAVSSARKLSKSASPVGQKNSAIPRPLNRRISYSPNRVDQILTEIGNGQLKRRAAPAGPLRSSENLQRPASESKRLSRSTADLKGPRDYAAAKPLKPPIPQRPKTLVPPAKSNEKPATTPSPTKLRSVQPTRNVAAVAEGAKKTAAASAVRTKSTMPKSPAKTVSSRSKENLSPASKIPSPLKTPKPPARLTKSPVRMPKSPVKTPKSPVKTPKSPAKTPKSPIKSPAKPSPKPVAKRSDKGQKDEPEAVAAAEEEPKPTASEEPKPVSEPPKEKTFSVRAVGRKALTTSNLLNSLRRKAVEDKQTPESANAAKEEKKDLPHTDTSRSLPISIGSAAMTESSVTLIRTTTEPALAPVQPDLITEIRSAINEVRSGGVVEETQCAKQEVTAVAADPTPMPAPVAVAEQTPPELRSNAGDEAAKVVEAVQKAAATPTMEPKNSPRPAHVIAVAKIAEPKQEITTNVVTIKQAVESEVQSANATQSENRNGISKSSWLNEKIQPEPMKKPTPKPTKEKQSTECLVQPAKPTRWKKFKSSCSKRVRKPETHPVHVSTITGASDPATAPRSKSCFGKYFCCFCYKCKLKRQQAIATLEEAKTSSGRCKCLPDVCCFRCKNGFKNLFGKLACRKKKLVTKSAESKAESGVACMDAGQPAPGCCGGCKIGVLGCLGIVCCWNKAFCVKLRGRCGKWCSCCGKCCSCCGRSKKTVITEPERRKSTISMTRKRKWTRVLTDFPKLDMSFVEHASIMRGAIPVLPVPLAWICLILNVFLPGFGTLSSGIFCLCVGKPRFSINDSIVSRIGSFVVNLLVAGSQLFTVLFCLVGWGWSIWWGVIMLKMAKKNKRIMIAEQTVPPQITSTVDQNHDPERGMAT